MKKQRLYSFEELYKIVGAKNLLTREEQMLDYSHDEFPEAEISQVPIAVVRPKSTRQVSEILKWANRSKIPLTPYT